MEGMAMASPKLFNYYLHNVFKFPKEIKNDIIYCQRSLKNYIKVHQRLFEYFQTTDGVDLITKKNVLDQVETEIYEINAEQNFLFLRLRRVIFEFNRILKQNNINSDKNTINLLITKEVVPMINNKSVIINPITVAQRPNEEELFNRFLSMIKKEKLIYEVLDSDEEMSINAETVVKSENKTRTYSAKVPNKSKSVSQMSLLKPMPQRNTNIKKESSYPDASQFLQIDMVEEKAEVAKDIATKELKVSSVNIAEVKKETIEMPVSKNVKLSRLNLREVLKNVRSSTMSKATPGVNPSTQSDTPNLRTSPVNTQTEPTTQAPSVLNGKLRTTISPPKVSKKSETKNKTKVSAAVPGKQGESSSSSEDSNQDIMMPVEEEEERTLPLHYKKEAFLRLFELFTPEVLTQMQQRRSKRKRRCVHSNEKADFHYGRLDYTKTQNAEEQKKKRKAFLLSPQVKQGLQAKRPKRCSADKKDDDVIDLRSSSCSPEETSPNQKQKCSKCLKTGLSLYECYECKKFFHNNCPVEDDTGKESIEEIVDPLEIKNCPSCRSTAIVVKIENLKSEAEALQIKLQQEKGRQENLQSQSKQYKIEIKNLYDIVKAVKGEEEDNPLSVDQNSDPID